MDLAPAKPGDPLRIPAATYNAMLGATRYVETVRKTVDGRPVGPPTGDVVLVRNDTANPRERFDVLTLAGPLILPSEAPDTFAARIVMSGIDPTGPADARGWAVLLEPAEPGVIVRAAVAGLTVARVHVTSDALTACDTAEGVATLETAASGLGTIVWRDAPESGVAWAIVRIGSAGTDSPERLVRVKKTGGAPGSAYSAPSWTYALYHHTPPAGVAWDDATNQLHPGPLQPELNHRSPGEWSAAPDGSLARAAFVVEDDTPTWHLLDCAEAPYVEFCNLGGEG